MKKKIISYIIMGATALTLMIGGTNAEAEKLTNKKQDMVKTVVSKTDAKKSNTSKPTKPKKAKLSTIRNAVKKAYGNDYIPNMSYDVEAIEEQFGIKPSWYTDVLAEGPMISMHVDTFIAVEAKAGKVKDVEKALKKYKDRLINETLQYPMNLPKINGSKILTVDNNVYFIMLGVIPEDTAKTDKAMLKAAKEQNDIAVKAIKKAMGK